MMGPSKGRVAAIMVSANNLVRSIFGFSRCNIRALVCSVEVAYDLMFVQGRTRDSIYVTKDIYPVVAKELCAKECDTVARHIERLCNRGWDRIKRDQKLMDRFVGNHAEELDAPSELIFFLACYMKYERPFREVLEQEPALTF